jgi:hypothetical protein
MNSFAKPEDEGYEETDREMLECLGARAVANLEQSVERTLAIAHDPESAPLAVIAACRVIHGIGAAFIRSLDRKSEVAALEARITAAETQLQHLLQEKSESAAGAVQ